MLALACAGAAESSGGEKGSPSSAVYFEETFFPVYVSKNDTETPAGGSAKKDVPTQTGWGVDTRTTLGYVWRGILLGATYNYFNVSSARPRTGDYEGLNELTSRQEWGVTLGFFLGHWRLTFTDFFNASKTFTQKYTDPVTTLVTTDETHKNSDGSGYQIGVGYDFLLGAGFGISPSLIFRHVSYAKQSYEVRTGTGIPYATTPLQTAAIDNELKPMITLNYWF